jgi:hypothetical protein
LPLFAHPPAQFEPQLTQLITRNPGNRPDNRAAAVNADRLEPNKPKQQEPLPVIWDARADSRCKARNACPTPSASLAAADSNRLNNDDAIRKGRDSANPLNNAFPSRRIFDSTDSSRSISA